MMKAPSGLGIWATLLVGCATTGIRTPAGSAIALDAPTAAGRALALELDGRDREAIELWLARTPDPWSAARLGALFDRTAPNARDLERLVAGGEFWRRLATDIANAIDQTEVAARLLKDAGGVEMADRCGPTMPLAELRAAPRDHEGWPILATRDEDCEGIATPLSHLEGPRAGGRVIWQLPHPATTMCLIIEGHMPWRLSQGERVVATHASDHALTPHVARITLVPADGSPTLAVIHPAGGDGPRVWFASSASCSPAIPPAERTLAPLAAFDLALADGDLAAAQDQLQALHTMPPDIAADAAIRLLRADHGASPLGTARLVLATLPNATANEPFALSCARAWALLESEDVQQARTLVDTLSAMRPSHPSIAAMRVTLAHNDGAMVDAMTIAAPFLGLADDTQLPATCAQRRELFDAIAPALWPRDLDPMKALPPDGSRTRACDELRLMIADALVTQGRLQASMALLRRLYRDAHSAMGTTLCERFQKLTKRQHPTPDLPVGCPDIPDVSSGKPGAPPMQALLLDSASGLPPLEAPRPRLAAALEHPLSDYAEVVWKERIDITDAAGHVASRQHRIFCLHDSDATTRLGEVPLSPASTLVLARTWKVHREPRQLLLQPIDFDHDTGVADVVSLPGLEPGDCAELVWLERHPPAPGVVPGFIAPVYHLDDDAGPTRAARWALHFAPRARADVHVQTQGPGSERWRVTETQDQIVIEAAGCPTAVAEPGDPRPDRRRASVVAHSRPDTARRLQVLAHDIAVSARPSVGSRAFAEARLAHDSRPTPGDLMDAIALAIEDDDERLGATPLADIHAFGRGSRALALWAAARAVALPAALVLARPLSEAGPGSDDRELEAWSWPLLFFGHAMTRLVLDPRSASRRPPPILGNVDAFVVASTIPDLPTGARIHTPPVDPGHRRGHVELAFLADGGRVEGRGEETLSGTFATAWREVIQRIPVENRSRLMTHVAEGSFPRLTTFDHALAGVGHDDPQLRWSWRVGGTATQISAERFELLLRIAPDDPLGATGPLAERRYPLFLNTVARHEHTLVVTWPAGWHAVGLPGDTEIDAGGFRYRREVRVAPDGRSLQVKRQWQTDPRWVTPDDFATVRDAAARIGQADTLRFDLVHARLLGAELPGPVAPLAGP